jgi:hypothetical protein
VTRSLVPSGSISPPQELTKFFDDPPLVGTEQRSEYDAFFATIARAERPVDAIDWLLLKDLVDIAWEIRRERRIKSEIIKIKQIEVISDLLKSTYDKTDRLGSALNRIFDAGAEAQLWASNSEARERINNKLAEKGYKPESVLAHAYLRGAGDIDAIERRIASYEARRNLILKEINLRSERTAQRLDKASSNIIDAEFSEAAE